MKIKESQAAKLGRGGTTPPESLTRKAALTNVNGLIEQTTRILSGFVITPVVVRMLGVELYGAWSMIGQIQSNLATSDFRASGTLKALLMLDQHNNNPEPKRRLVAASLIVWAGSLVLLAIVGAFLILYAPAIIGTGPVHSTSVRVAVVLTILSMAFAQLFSIPSNMLRGSNLDYKSIGLRTVVGLIVAVSGVVAAVAGFGLPGLAGAGLFGTLLMGVVWTALAKRYVDWFGVSFPSRNEFRSFFKDSIAFVFINQGQTLLLASDILLVGFFFGPVAAGVYSTAGILMRFGSIPVVNIIGSATPGLVGICGQGDWRRASIITAQISNLALVISGAVAVVSVALNEQFIAKILGINAEMPRMLTVILVVLSVVQFVYRIESSIFDGLRSFKMRAVITINSGLAGGLVSWLLSRFVGEVGVAIGMIFGASTAIALLAKAIRERTGSRFSERYRGCFRIVAVAAALVAAGHFAEISMGSWIMLLAVGVGLGFGSLVILVMCGMRRADRDLLWMKIKNAF